MTAPAPAPVPVTIDDLEQHLSGLFGGGLTVLAGAPWAPGSSRASYACEGDGAIEGGDAVTCRWEPVCDDPSGCGPAQWPDPRTVLVAVLDDNGRYTFTVLDAGEDAPHAGPGDYPDGSTSCAVLAGPPAHRPTQHGLAYPALLHQWMSLGRPTSMDPDGDGRPCEEAYPDEVVSATLGSPLAPHRRPATAPPTMDDVRAHAQAVLSGFFGPTLLACDGGSEPATTGGTMACEVHDPIRPDLGYTLYLVVLDDTGGYLVAPDSASFWVGCAGLDDYPPLSACSQLAQPPPGWTTCSRGVSYGEVLYQWFMLGRPADWDVDGDGRPCEDAFGDPPDVPLLHP